MAYSYYKTVVIDYTKVAASLTDFPVALIRSSDNDLRTVANGGHVQNTTFGGAGGNIAMPADLVFSPNSDGSSPYSFEIEKYTATTGELVAHIKIPTLSNSADTTLYICYGDSGVTTSQENVTSVWDSNYKGVWHFAETSGTQYDATSNNNDGTPSNLATQGTANAKMGGANDYNNSTSKLGVGVGSSLDVEANLTLEAWIYCDGLSGNDAIWIKYTAAGAGFMLYVRGSTANLAIYDWTGSAIQSTASVLTTGAWYHVVAQVTNDVIAYFVNGVAKGGGSYSIDLAGVSTAYIGNDSSDTYSFDGQIDELRLSDIPRTQNWYITQYNNQVDATIGTGKFLKSISSEQSGIVNHSLTSKNIATPAPTQSKSSIAQIHALVDRDIATPVPTVTKSIIAQIHALTDKDISTPVPTVSKASLNQIVALVSINISTPVPAVTKSIISQIHALSDKDISTPEPTISKSIIGQVHTLVDKDITTPDPTVTQSAIAQNHAIESQDIATPVPTVSKSALEIEPLDVDNLVSKNISTIPTYSKADIAQVHILTDKDIQTGYATITQTTIGQVHVFVSEDIATPEPTVSRAVLGITSPDLDALVAQNIVTGIPTYEQADIAQIQALISINILLGIPAISKPDDYISLPPGNRKIYKHSLDQPVSAGSNITYKAKKWQL